MDDSRKKEIIDDFHKLYYNSGVWKKSRTQWAGKNILKCPMDMWMYQEIIFKNRPDVIIETGTCFGGSALYFAQMMDLAKIPGGKVVTMDIANPGPLGHNRIKFIQGSSVDKATVAAVKSQVAAGKKVMVTLDSDHKKKHVLKEMSIYGSMVTTGQYMVVEDTNINGNPVRPGWGDGPAEAVAEYMKGNANFIVDESCEKFFITLFPGGFLKKVGK